MQVEFKVASTSLKTAPFSFHFIYQFLLSEKITTGICGGLIIDAPINGIRTVQCQFTIFLNLGSFFLSIIASKLCIILNPGLPQVKPGFGFEVVNPGLGYPGAGFGVSTYGQPLGGLM